MSNKALGRGLSALIPPKTETASSGTPVNALKIEQISPNKKQPRKAFHKQSLEELKSSIKSKGVLQPIIVRPLGADRYEIIAGERRFRAVSELGLKEIPCLIKVATDTNSLELALIENLQRDDLNPIEEARAYQQLIEEHGFTHQQISESVSKDRSTITNTLRLLSLPGKAVRFIEEGLLSAGHGKLLVGLASQEKQLRMAEYIVKKSLSVRETEVILGRTKDSRENVKIPKDRNILKLEEEISSIFGTKTIIKNSRKNKGAVTVEYYSLDDLDRILTIIRGTGRKPL